MGKALLLFAVVVTALALVLRHYHYVALCVLLLWTALLAAICGVMLYRQNPLTDILEDMRRHAD